MTQRNEPGVPSAKAAGRDGTRKSPPVLGYTTSAGPSSGGNGQVCRRGRWVSAATPQGRQWVGWLEPRNGATALVKRVKRSRHLLRDLDAWGVQVAVLDWLEDHDIALVEVHEAEDGVTYQATVRTFREHGIRRDLGHGEQVFLPRQYWLRTAECQRPLFSTMTAH